ncbi:hypothetical protein BASA62_005194 [Batrachochytrium salamandrivorans]|nr:hypothetical protein BASA62_005194 [Batrachochytrium salamandrivorans]
MTTTLAWLSECTWKATSSSTCDLPLAPSIPSTSPASLSPVFAQAVSKLRGVTKGERRHLALPQRGKEPCRASFGVLWHLKHLELVTGVFEHAGDKNKSCWPAGRKARLQNSTPRGVVNHQFDPSSGSSRGGDGLELGQKSRRGLAIHGSDLSNAEPVKSLQSLVPGMILSKRRAGLSRLAALCKQLSISSCGRLGACGDRQ